MSLNVDNVKEMVIKIAEVINENKEELSQLDAAIGDGDHGHNMSRGFLKVVEELRNNSYDDIGSIFKKVGMVLVSNVGGASGPLYGTAFLKAATFVNNKKEIDINDFLFVYNKQLTVLKFVEKLILVIKQC